MPDPGELFAHRYRLERELARGGMGSVWVAADERLSRTVAIKFMDPALAGSDDLQARFRREASAAGALRTRHVVQVHDFGVEDDTPYIVMEMLDGEDLGARLSRVRRLPLAEAASLGLQIARGLRHAHEAGIVHRDLKPQNLFLCREDDAEIVKILDFGVAKRTGLGAPLGEATSTKQLLGSPQFMSPEQTRARGVDHRSDVWALGVILYRMLTGTLPFQSDHVVDLIIRIQSEPHPPPSSIDPALAPLDAFFERALAKEPEARFASASELAEELARLAASSTAPALMPPPPLAAVPLPMIATGTPAPTPAPSGASPLVPSMYGVAPPSLRPGSGSAPRAAGIPVALGVGGMAIATALVAVIALVALGGEEPSAAASPGVGARPASSGVAPMPDPDPAATEAVEPAAPAAATSAPGAAPSASAAPSATASASAGPSVTASAPVAPRVPAPRPSGEKKLLLTY